MVRLFCKECDGCGGYCRLRGGRDIIRRCRVCKGLGYVVRSRPPKANISVAPKWIAIVVENEWRGFCNDPTCSGYDQHGFYWRWASSKWTPQGSIIEVTDP